MTSIIGFLESIEKLAYKILLWLILIPKTIVQITLNAGWAPEYIAGELKQEKSPFDEYISPIVLLLIVAFIPAVAFNFLPVFGTTISSPAEKDATTERFLRFDSETNFKSGSTSMENTYSWFIEKITTDEDGNEKWEEIYRENHDSNNWYIEYVSNNITRDAFYYEFAPGEGTNGGQLDGGAGGAACSAAGGAAAGPAAGPPAGPPSLATFPQPPPASSAGPTS